MLTTQLLIRIVSQYTNFRVLLSRTKLIFLSKVRREIIYKTNYNLYYVK